MPIEHHFDARARTLRVRLVEPLERGQLSKFALSIAADTSLPAARLELWDFRGITGSEATTELRRIAEAFAQEDVAGTRVALCADTDLTFGLCRMFAGFCAHSPATFQVFRALDTAEAWLEAGRAALDDVSRD